MRTIPHSRLAGSGEARVPPYDGGVDSVSRPDEVLFITIATAPQTPGCRDCLAYGETQMSEQH